MARRQGLSFGRGAVCAMLLAGLSVSAVAAAPAHDLGGQAAVATAAAEDVTIYLSIGPTHTDLIFPRQVFADAPPLVKYAADHAVGGPWVIIGWGPYWFGRRAEGGPYHFFPLLSAHAVYTTIVPQLFSQIRVAALDAPGHAPDEHNMTLVPLRMSAADVLKSLARINASFSVGKDGGPVLPDQRGTAPGVIVYRSREVYHVTHECNHWTSEVLRAGNVRTNTFLDTLPMTLQLDVKSDGDAARDAGAKPEGTRPQVEAARAASPQSP